MQTCEVPNASLIIELHWFPNQDGGRRDLLLALHPTYSLILWNADTGEKIWKKSYTETLSSFSIDPFNANQLAC